VTDGSLGVRSGERSSCWKSAVEALLAEPDKDEVGDDHPDEESEERGGERSEAEHVR
jgi:hypothetical protein